MEPLLNAVYYGEDRKDGRSNRLCSPLGQMVSTCIADQLAASDGRRKMGQRESARRNTMVRRIAIVGGGVSGLGAAWALHHHRDRFNFRAASYCQRRASGSGAVAVLRIGIELGAVVPNPNPPKGVCERPPEEAKGCTFESEIMVLQHKTCHRKGAPNRCYHVTTLTASKSPSTIPVW